MPYAKRSILTGFPRPPAHFQTRAEVDQYLAGERVQCLLCGHQYRILETHLRGVHQINGDAYREMYGIPYRRGLCGSAYSERRTELGRALWAENTERQAAALASAAAVQARDGNPQRNKPTFWKFRRMVARSRTGTRCRSDDPRAARMPATHGASLVTKSGPLLA